MRAKRSKDAQLVDKFNKQRDQMAAESPMPRPVKPAADEDDTHSVDGEEVDLKVRNVAFVHPLHSARLCGVKVEDAASGEGEESDKGCKTVADPVSLNLICRSILVQRNEKGDDMQTLPNQNTSVVLSAHTVMFKV